MSDLISRQDAIEQIQVWAVNLANPKMLSREDAIYILESMPSANKSGHWAEENDKYHTAICSECGKVTMFETWGYAVRKYDFCPNCGSRNIEEVREEDDL